MGGARQAGNDYEGAGERWLMRCLLAGGGLGGAKAAKL